MPSHALTCPGCGGSAPNDFSLEKEGLTPDILYYCSKCDTVFDEQTGLILGNRTTRTIDHIIDHLNRVENRIDRILMKDFTLKDPERLQRIQREVLKLKAELQESKNRQLVAKSANAGA